MMSWATIFWLIALAAMVLFTVTVSLKVDQVNAEIADVTTETEQLRRRLELLDASYHSLTRPDELARLATQHLQLEEVRGDQLMPLENLPPRIPLPTARRREPKSQELGETKPAPHRTPPQQLPVPRDEPPSMARPPSAVPPWLEAQGQSGLQPVKLAPSKGGLQ